MPLQRPNKKQLRICAARRQQGGRAEKLNATRTKCGAGKSATPNQIFGNESDKTEAGKPEMLRLFTQIVPLRPQNSLDDQQIVATK